MFDTVLTGGTVYDGDGGPPQAADVGVKDGKVAAIGDLAAADAAERLDAAGLAVAPGFIDLHTHSDFTLLVDGRAESQVHQGVTTEVIGQCGFSCAPVRCDADVHAVSVGYRDGTVRLGWRSFGDYLDRLDATSLGVNVAALVGQGAVHRAVMGDALQPPGTDAVQAMADLVDEALDQGAAGLSSGLEYWPGSLMQTDQLAKLAARAGRRGRLYATHVRNRDIRYDQGFGEALETAEHAGARLQISHIQPKFGAPPGAMDHTLQMIEIARGRGVDVAFDVIPHDWSHTRVSAILPQWAQEGGLDGVRRRLQTDADRARIKQNPEPMWRLVSAGLWDRIVLLRSAANPHLVGADFAAIGRDRGCDPYDAVLDLLLEEGDGLHQMLWTSHSFSQDDIVLCLRQPECAVISDTLALAPEGPLADQIGSLSGYGWAARFLATYVRELGVLTLPDAIRRLTALPADRLGLTDRGRLRPGLWADITVFDPDAVVSRCSVAAPRRYAAGIAHVLVNGRTVLRDGTRGPDNPGQVLRAGG